MTVTETREIALGNDEKWMNSRYTVKVVCIGFSDRLDGWVGKGEGEGREREKEREGEREKEIMKRRIEQER